jgi:ribosome-associated protein
MPLVPVQGFFCLCYNNLTITDYWRQQLEGIDLARKIVEIASDKQAIDISLLDVKQVCSFADYFVLCSCDAERQMDALAEEIIRVLKQQKIYPLHKEGTPESGWLLIDYNDVIVHILSPREREYYRLDELWKQANPIVRIQ